MNFELSEGSSRPRVAGMVGLKHFLLFIFRCVNSLFTVMYILFGSQFKFFSVDICVCILLKARERP